jgi:hypothetical protein
MCVCVCVYVYVCVYTYTYTYTLTYIYIYGGVGELRETRHTHTVSLSHTLYQVWVVSCVDEQTQDFFSIFTFPYFFLIQFFIHFFLSGRGGELRG